MFPVIKQNTSSSRGSVNNSKAENNPPFPWGAAMPGKHLGRVVLHLSEGVVGELAPLYRLVTRYRKMPIFRTPTVISDKPGGFTAFLATGKVIDKYKMLKLLN